MLIQLHHQNKKNLTETEMIAQFDVDNVTEMDKESQRVMRDHPLPDGWQWLWVMEGSRFFWMTRA